MNEVKRINLKESVYEICETYPEVIEILMELGFRDITKPGMLQTAGRFMTIPKGAKMKHIDMAVIVDKFRKNGYELVEGEEK